jgi:ubiquitin C-terminal hydrolase
MNQGSAAQTERFCQGPQDSLVPKGLRNSGNDCYQSACLQVLLRVPLFWDLVGETSAHLGANSPKGSFCRALTDFRFEMLSASAGNSEQATNQLRGHIYKRFDKNQQHDAHEFFMWVTSELNDAVAGQPRLE